MADPQRRIPAQYIGSTMLILMPGQGTGFNADGTRRDTRTISQGDILLMPEKEILGYTLLYEGDQWYDMGVGKCVKPEHAGLAQEELVQLGYEFHQGRTDFQAIASIPALSTQEQTVEKVPVEQVQNQDEGGQ